MTNWNGCGLLYGTLLAFTGRTVENHKETVWKQTSIHQTKPIFLIQNQQRHVSACNQLIIKTYKIHKNAYIQQRK
jgi:hypothetical protein